MTSIKVKPFHEGKEHGVKMTIKLDGNLPEVLRPKYTAREMEMLEKGFVAGRLGSETLQELKKKFNS